MSSSPTRTLKLSIPRPHITQQQILNDLTRFKVLCCGRRWGKTELSQYALLFGHAPNTAGAIAGYPVCYVALTEKNADEMWRRLRATIPEGLLAYKNDTKKYLRLLSGGTIECWTFINFQAARGRAYAGLILDEAAQTSELQEAFEDVFLGSLVDFSGWGIVESTPQGFNFFYDLFQRGIQHHPGWGSWQFSSYANPFLAADELDRVKAMLPETTFRREYMAEFCAAQGLIFDQFSFADNVTVEAEYQDGLPVYWGVDDGYAHGDGVGTAGYHPRVILLAQQTPTGGFNVFAEYVQTLELAEVSIRNVLALPYTRPTMVMVDSSAPELRQHFNIQGLVNWGATHQVSEGIKVMRRYICDGQGQRLLRIHPRCQHLIRELQSYRYDENSRFIQAGEPKPLKLDDHSVDACRYILWNFR